MMGTLLWIASVILVILGIVELLHGALLFGILLIIVGCLVGPGGVSIFNGRSRV
jgi:hypothetical protein